MKINKYPISQITSSSPNWPKLLDQLKDPPKQLYYRGTWNLKLFDKALAVVGSRRMTRYGEQVLERLIPSLIAEKVTIISGFMYGIDTKAHRECLACGGKTVAVLGGGLDVLYPPENEELYYQICQNGLIISEYEPNQQPQLWTFPQRNRLVATLASLGVLVVEAGEKSGSLITAKIAKKLTRPLFSVPGPITSSVCVGSNQLLKTGQAKMVLTASDIIKNSSQKIENSQPDNEILILLSAEPLSADQLAIKLNKNISKLTQELVLLSLEGKIEDKNGKYYRV